MTGLPNKKTPGSWALVDLPATGYETVRSLQLALVNARRAGAFDGDVVIFTEHFPVFTLGRRGGTEFIKKPFSFLEKAKISVTKVERGGTITFHAPGQLVIYPVVSLKQNRRGVAAFVHDLEEVMIRTAADWKITARRDGQNRGVWVGKTKLGSLGIAVRRGIAFHGLALNVNLDMDPFSWIDPCGLAGVSMTSMEKQIRDQTAPDLNMAAVRASARRHVAQVFGKDLFPMDLKELTRRLPQMDEDG